MSPRLPSTLKTLALSCFVAGPVLHGFTGPGVGAAAVALGLGAYLIGLLLSPLVEARAARWVAALSAVLGGWYLITWGWLRFGEPPIDAVPMGADPWLGRGAMAVEIAALSLALGRRGWIWGGLLALLWLGMLPPVQRVVFLGAPQVAVLSPSLLAVAAMLALNQRARLARSSAGDGVGGPRPDRRPGRQ